MTADEKELVDKIEGGADIDQIVEDKYESNIEGKKKEDKNIFESAWANVTGRMNNSLGYFVPGLKAVDDVDKFRYSVKANRRLN